MWKAPLALCGCASRAGAPQANVGTTMTAITAHASHGNTDFLMPSPLPLQKHTLGPETEPYGPYDIKSTDLGRQRGKTAVASISTRASASTNAITWTTAIGKCLPMTSR